MSVTEPPFGPLEVLQAPREPLAAHQPRHRRVDVLEQRVQRAHRDRVGARDRRRPELRVLEMGPRVAPDLRPHRLARGGAAGRHGRLDRRAQQLERGVGARRRRPRPRAWAARARARSCSARAAAPGPLSSSGGSAAARPAAGTRASTLVAREQQRALVERLDDLDVGRLHARPTAPRRPASATARARPRGPVSIPLQTSWKPRMSSCFASRAHHRAAAVAEERRGGAVDEHQVADRPARDGAAEVAPECGRSRAPRTRGASRPGSPTRSRAAA